MTGETRSSGLHVPGFQHLEWLLPQHVDLAPELYFLFIALMMGQPTKLLPADTKLDLDNVWHFLFGVPPNKTLSTYASKINLCSEAIVILLIMVKCMVNTYSAKYVVTNHKHHFVNIKLANFFSPDNLPVWLHDYPVTIIQYLFFLYHNFTDFMPFFMNAEVLGGLAGTLFPKPASSSHESSGASSPVDEVRNKVTYPHVFVRTISDFCKKI